MAPLFSELFFCSLGTWPTASMGRSCRCSPASIRASKCGRCTPVLPAAHGMTQGWRGDVYMCLLLLHWEAVIVLARLSGLFLTSPIGKMGQKPTEVFLLPCAALTSGYWKYGVKNSPQGWELLHEGRCVDLTAPGISGSPGTRWE